MENNHLGPREKWFNWYSDELNKGIVMGPEDDYIFACPCCGYPTLGTRGGFEICEICFWEDDGQDSHNADLVLGGPNGDYSLTEARKNFEEHFTCYRPSDKRPFTQSARRIEQAKLVGPKLASFRWAGRVRITSEIESALAAMSKIR